MQVKSYSQYTPEHEKLYHEILQLTDSINDTYPRHTTWFLNTFLPGLKKGERSYIVAFDDTQKLVGCILMKRTKEENKICTLFVHPDFRNRGVATTLMQTAFDQIQEHPLITVSSRNIASLSPLLAKFGFHLSAAKKGAYGQEDTEYYFNDKKVDLVKDKLIPLIWKAAQKNK